MSAPQYGGVYVPPGQYPPFAVVTSTDHTAWIIIATALGLACVLVFSAIRAFVKTSTWGIGFSYDGSSLLLSIIIAIIQSCVVLGACAKGLGKSIELVPEKNHGSVQQMYYTSLVLFVIALGLSKISVVFLLLSLTPHEQHRKIFQGVIGLLIVWTIASIFAVALQCDLAHPWITVGEKCSGAFKRWQIISAFDIIFEIGMVAMAVYLVWSLRTSTSNKVVVVFAFAFRLPMIVAIAFRIAKFNTPGYTTNPMFLEDVFIVWTQTELNYSIISAIVPSLRPFVKNLSTNYGQEGAARQAQYGTGHEGSSGNYQLTNLASVARRGSVDLEERYRGNPDDYNYKVWANKRGNSRNGRHAGEGSSNMRKPYHDESAGDGLSVGSSDSQRMIIKKDVTWVVEHDGMD